MKHYELYFAGSLVCVESFTDQEAAALEQDADITLIEKKE